MVAAHEEAARLRARPAGKVLEQPLNPRFAKAVTAVRGKLTMKANQYRQALDRGEGKALPFDRVVTVSDPVGRVEIGSARRPSFSQTFSSTAGSMLAKVPTAPEIAQVATSARAAIMRALQRSNSA